MSLGLTELHRRYNNVVAYENQQVLAGRLPWSEPCYYGSTLVDYDDFLGIAVGNGHKLLPSAFIREGITILDVLGPGVFIDACDRRRFAGLYGLTATDTDNLLRTRRQFHPDRKPLIVGNVFEPNIWNGVPQNVDLACCRIGCGLDKQEIYQDGFYDDYYDLPHIAQSIYGELLKLLCNVYNNLTQQNGVFFAAIPSEQLMYGEAIGNLNQWLQTALKVNGITAYIGEYSRSQTDRIFIQKTSSSPPNITPEDLCQISILGCRKHEGCERCDLAGLKTKNRLRELLVNRAPTMVTRPGYVSKRHYGNNTTRVWLDDMLEATHASCVRSDNRLNGQI